jgi:ureidoacrylate peracid hydrolase
MDIMNELIDPKAKIGSEGFAGHAIKTNIVNNTYEALEYARKNNIMVIFVNVGFTEGYRELPKNSKLFKKLEKDNLLLLNEKGTEFPDKLKRIDGELFISKNRINSFYGTNLDLVLRTNHITDLYLSGIATEFVILSTALSAHDYDYRVNIIRQCISSSSEATHKTVCELLNKFANLIDLDVFLGVSS